MFNNYFPRPHTLHTLEQQRLGEASIKALSIPAAPPTSTCLQTPESYVYRAFCIHQCIQPSTRFVLQRKVPITQMAVLSVLFVSELSHEASTPGGRRASW